MKSSFWVLCGVVLLCFGSVRCKRHFSDNDDNFLDKTGEGDKIRTEKEEDTEWQLYKARSVLTDLTNDVDELSRLQRGEVEDKCSKDDDCKHDGTCDGVGADGSKTCNCKDGTTGDTCEKITDCETNGKYEKCTGNRGTCGFVNGNSNCACADEKKLYETVGYCEVSCEDTPCVGPNRKCNDDKFCVCEDGYEGEDCDIVTGCKTLAPKCKEINTKCVFDKDAPEKAVCECESDFLYERNENKCKKKCSGDGDCQNEGSCLGEDDSKLCKCKDGTTGDKCEKITDCEIKGKYENCTGNRGTCGFEGGNSKCECPSGKQLYDAVGYCEVPCDGDTPCDGSNRKCNDAKFCVCEDGYEGEDCDIVTGCKTLATKCKEIETECVFDKGAPEKAVCKCEGDLVYEREENKCKNPCEGFECKNGGTCEVKNKKPTCNCPDRFIGDNCEKDLCEGFECKNGGTCEMKNKKPSCKCPDQFIGDKCEKDLCEGFECKNGGTCEMKNKKPSCKCPDQYIGDKCEKDLCAELECKNGGTCEVKNGKAACKCPDQFVGDNCETDKCQILECKNGGTCEVKNAKAVCKCPDQFTGDNCETDKCAGYCKNDGTCEIKDKKPICKCKDDYAGKQCEQLTKDKCAEKLDICAKTNGTCIAEDAEKITCICRTDFAFDEEEGCKERDYCQEICGDNTGVKCIGDKKKKETVTCSCDDENEAFDKTDKECKTDHCKRKCGSVKCEGNKFVESEVQCKCTNADQDFIEAEKQCKINYCRKVCGSGDRIKCGGDGDEYTAKEQKDCSCDDDDYLYIKGKKYCQKKCSDVSDCKNNGTCKGNENSKLCNCVFGTTGDTCDVITACETGKYANCKGSRGECTFEKGKPICKCADGKELYDGLGYCEEKCKEDKSCEGNNRVCNKDNFCVCQDGYEGEECNIVSGCKVLKEKCDEIKVECVFSKDAPLKATCQCENDYVYDRDNNKCKNPFCFPSDPCKKPAECSDDEATGIGFCKCPDTTYYNYRTTSCENLGDKCLLKKTSCGENEECRNGKCECKYKKEGDECKPKLCTPNPCFANANCSESDGSCFCDEGKYFSNNKKCEKAKCRLTEYKTNCSCPSEMERQDGSSDCVPKKNEVEACDQDCGYGLCISKNKKNYCKCFAEIAVDNNGKCALKSSFCAGGKLQEDKMKCKCEGQFTQADDGITCRLKTCEDDDVKKECASRGGVCKMQWKGKGYDCECPKGYLLGGSGKCTDPCSLENNIEACSKIGKFCYNSISSKNAGTFECGCPPAIKGDGCSAKAENAYIIKNIPVLKKAYETKSGINKVLLNVDLVKSMELTFSSVLFESGYLYDYRVGDSVLNCSVWINFKREPSKAELNAMKLVPRTFSKLCDDCDDSAVVWPPRLLLSEKGLQEAVPDKLGFCSNEVKDLLCGKGAKCEKDRCTCDEGFKIIEYSIKEIASFKTQRCEDIDECALGVDVCSKNKNTICVNTFGSYKCVCKEGFKKKETPKDPETDKSDCYDMCSPSPCIKGECLLKNKTFDCKCQTGVTGSFCDRADEDYKSAKKGTVVVGAVLGTLLAVIVLGVLFYIIKKKKRSGSEDFMPAPRLDHAEMAERRGMRGVSNKAYE